MTRTWTALLPAWFGILLLGPGCAEAAPPESPATPEPPCDYLTADYTGRELLTWTRRIVDGLPCIVSPPLRAGAGYEANHHRITVQAVGEGTITFSVAHSATASLDRAISKKSLHTPLRAITPGAQTRVASPYKGERFAWLILRMQGQIRITGVRHTFWRGKGTLYGHVGRKFAFAGGTLPYRLMYPPNYDPAKAYPLVLSVSGSGGVGTDNAANMEMVILGRYLFTTYRHDPKLACFSLVPQIPPGRAVPKPYSPAGERGGPTPVYHPGWSAVNENGWYVEATLALIRSLIADKAVSIDADRVYYSGFSYGGKACWEFAKAGRTVFAGAMCGAGWPIGRAGATPDAKLLARLSQEVQRYKHIPVSIFAGEQDVMKDGSEAVHKLITARGGTSRYIEFPNTGHTASAAKIWGRRAHVQWLFQQNRTANPAPGADPFPNGQYPE